MAIDRWDPFREMMTLRDAMDRLFQESYVRPGRGLSTGGGSTLPLDISEENDNFVVRASMPGIKPEDVHITVHGNTLTIRAESKRQEERKDQNWIVRERQMGTMQRSLSLPTGVNASAAQARFENGELILTLPKAEEAKPRRIPVGGAAGQVGQLAGASGSHAEPALTDRRGQPLGANQVGGSTQTGTTGQSNTSVGAGEMADRERAMGQPPRSGTTPP